MVKIIIANIMPPIPDRNHDFAAHVAGKEEDGIVGYGHNAAAALVSLLDLLWENDAREDYHAALAALIDTDMDEAKDDGRNASFVGGLKSAKRTIEGAAP